MNILITGAAGFVGRNLVENLKAIRDGKNRTRPNLNIEAVYEYDVNNSSEELEQFCSDCDFVFNLAGVNRPKDVAEFKAGNFGFASQLLATLKKHNNKCPVMLSSSIQATLAGRFGTSEYGLSKKAGEELFFNYAKETGAVVYVYRFPNLAGKWIKPNYNSAIGTFCYNIANDLPITVNDPTTELELLFIDDLLEELYDCLEGKPHHCDYPQAGSIIDGLEYDGLTPLWSDEGADKGTDEGRYCGCPVTHKATLGRIVELLHTFHDQPQNLIMPAIPPNSFEKKLYSMYLSYLPKEKIAFDLKMNTDERGSFTEILKTLDHGQFSVNITKPGVKKGEHWHNSKWEFFIVVSGHGLIQERKIGSNDVIEFEVSGEKIQAVHMLPGYVHNIKNLSETENLVTLIWANEIFNQKQADTFHEEVYYPKLLDDTVRKIENDIDSYHLSLEYLNNPLQQAIFDVLRVFENLIQNIDNLYQIKNSAPAHDEAKQRCIDALSMALRWIYEKNLEDNKSFSYNLSDCEYWRAHDFLLKYALKYSQVCEAYISYSRKRFLLDKIEDKKIFFVAPSSQELAFVAEMSNFFDDCASLSQYVNKKLENVIKDKKDIIAKSSTLNCFDETGICKDETFVQAFLDIADFYWRSTSLLPQDWQFNNFSLEDYRLCWRELFAESFLYENRISYLLSQKSSEAYTHNVIVQKRENLIKHLLQRTCLNENTINNIVDMLIFNYQLKRSNIIEQPLVSVNDWIFIVPSLFINSVPERNLIALIQRLNRDTQHFNEVNKLEGLMRSQIEEHICETEDLKLCHDIDIKDTSGTSTDVDFGIFDMKSNSVMMCELKWLIEANATADVYAREDDVDHGCKQIEKAMGYAMCNSKAFIKKAFDIDIEKEKNVEFFCCVVTKANVRNNSKTVPVINQQKFIELLKQKTSYRDMFEKIREKNYQHPFCKDIKIEYSLLDYAGYLFSVPSASM